METCNSIFAEQHTLPTVLWVHGLASSTAGDSTPSCVLRISRSRVIITTPRVAWLKHLTSHWEIIINKPYRCHRGRNDSSRRRGDCLHPATGLKSLQTSWPKSCSTLRQRRNSRFHYYELTTPQKLLKHIRQIILKNKFDFNFWNSTILTTVFPIGWWFFVAVDGRWSGSVARLSTGQLVGILADVAIGYVTRLALFNVDGALIQLLGHVILDVLPQRARIRVTFQTARHLASVRLLQMSIIKWK